MSKYRLVTRSDFDGLVCAMLLKEIDLIDAIDFVHPKDVQDGNVEISANDITANIPYVETAHLVFDHHYSEMLRTVGSDNANYINIPNAPSAARVIYDYYGGRDKFPNIAVEMMEAVDRADSGKFTKNQVLNEAGWDLLSFLMDPRTGLGRFRNFAVSNYDLMMKLIDYCRNHTIDEILALPDVKERIELFFEHRPLAEAQMKRCGVMHGSLVVIDLRDEDPIYCANRFLVYALFPQSNISMHVMWGRQKQNVVFAIGKSIFNRSSKVDIDSLTLSYGGGGHESAGTCQVGVEEAERVEAELIEAIKRGG